MKKNATNLGLLLGKNIADRRNALGLTQAELAEKIGADTVTCKFQCKNAPDLLGICV